MPELLLDKQPIHSLRRNSKLTTIITIPEGYYTLDALREQVVREQNHFQKSKFKIKRNSEGYYFTSKVDLMLDREFYEKLGLPEVINKDKFYELKSLPNKPLFLFCDIINSHNSYTGFEISGEAKFKPSNLLAVLPSENYPSLEVENSSLLLNQIILRIEDEKGVKPQFNETILFSLKLSQFLKNMMQCKKFYPNLPEKSGSLDLPTDLLTDLPENSSNFRLQKSCEALLKNSKKKQSIIIMYEKNISAIIIFFLRSVYQQVLSLLF